MKETLKLFIPPVFLKAKRKLFAKTGKPDLHSTDSSQQELDVYWTDEMAHELENWGKDHTWNEIECLLVNCKGKVLDIACGTGVNIAIMSRFKNIEIYGFDISDFLISKAVERGIPATRLKVQDATKTTYADNEFDYSYSIGSLEHFTEEGIDLFLKECSRYTAKSAFHMIPVSESNLDDGWIRTNQSYFNNSVEWWLPKFRRYFREVYVLGSGYKHIGVSGGKWFVCIK